MTPESRYTRSFIEAVQKRHPKCLIIKLSDRFSLGVPDMVYANGPITVWVEVKQWPAHSANFPNVPLDVGPQLMMMMRLEQNTRAAAYLCYIKGRVKRWVTEGGMEHLNHGATWASFWKPSMIHSAIHGKFAPSLEPTWDVNQAIQNWEVKGYTMLQQQNVFGPQVEFLEYLGGKRP